MNILNIVNHNPHTVAVKTVEKSSNIQANKTSLPFNRDKDGSGVVLNISNRALQLSKHPMFALNKSSSNGDNSIKHLFGRDNMEIDAGSLVERGATTTPTTPATLPSGEPFDFFKALRAGMQARVDAAEGEEKKDLEMRLYSHDYCQIFSGGSPNGWGKLDMETMYSQAADIYKQIEDSSDSEETKELKRQALQNALRTGTGMYRMRMVGEKMRNDALEAEAQGKAIDRSYRSKVKFDKLCEISGALHNITSMFFNNLKNGKSEGVDYGSMITDAVNKMMSYRPAKE